MHHKSAVLKVRTPLAFYKIRIISIWIALMITRSFLIFPSNQHCPSHHSDFEKSSKMSKNVSKRCTICWKIITTYIFYYFIYRCGIPTNYLFGRRSNRLSWPSRRRRGSLSQIHWGHSFCRNRSCRYFQRIAIWRALQPLHCHFGQKELCGCGRYCFKWDGCDCRGFYAFHSYQFRWWFWFRFIIFVIIRHCGRGSKQSTGHETSSRGCRGLRSGFRCDRQTFARNIRFATSEFRNWRNYSACSRKSCDLKAFN